MNQARKRISHRSIVVGVVIMAVAMFILGFVMVPLYEAFSRTTGHDQTRINVVRKKKVAGADINPTTSIQLNAGIFV